MCIVGLKYAQAIKACCKKNINSQIVNNEIKQDAPSMYILILSDN